MYKVKSKLNIEEEHNKNEIENDIVKLKIEKSQLFINAGIRIYEKIRKNEITDESIICEFEEVKEIDKKIYEINNQLQILENKNQFNCECGTSVDINSKFCSECGRKIEIDKEETIICKICNSEVNKEYIYCVCCGNKLYKD